MASTWYSRQICQPSSLSKGWKIVCENYTSVIYITLVNCHLLHKLVGRTLLGKEASFVSDLNVFIPNPLPCLRLKHVYFKNTPKLSILGLVDPSSL